MGYDANDWNIGNCNSSWAYSCGMVAIPSGPDADHPTRILGENWDTKTSEPPELWGTGRSLHIFDLSNSSNVDLEYLDITDHMQCGYNFIVNSSLLCDRSIAPYGDQADYGIYAVDSTNVLLKNIKIHGLSIGAMWGGRLTDWTFEGVEMHANAFSGWNGDVGHGVYDSGTDSSMHGTITIKDSKINYTGCVENYPLTGIYPDIVSGGCYGQGQGGYGDGLGMYNTEGNWVFQNSEIMHNTQDGIDLLYHTGQTGTVIMDRMRSEGNAGQQVKIGASGVMENSVVIGDCNYFYNNPIAYQTGFPHCRAAGTPIVLSGWRIGHEFSIVNSTITGPNKIFIEAGSAGNLSNAAGTGNVTGVPENIIYDGGFVVNQAQDTIWLRWPGGFDPNYGEIVPRWNNYTSRVKLTGSWVYDGDGIYHMSGIGSQTGGVYVFNDVIRNYLCDGNQKIYSRNNILLGLEWWSASQLAIVPGTYADTLYLDGWDGNGAGSCAATEPVGLDNKNSIIYNSKFNLCSTENNVLCVDPGLSSIPPYSAYDDIYMYGERWNVVPLTSSPAIDNSGSAAGTIITENVTVPLIDMLGNPRPFGNGIDWGAYEVGSSIDLTPPSVPSGLSVM